MSAVAEDLTGTRFGKLVVAKRAGVDKWGSTRWLCKCDCGRNIYRSRSYFFAKEGRKFPISSCGCAYKHFIKRDLTGQRFGRWVVLRHDNKTDNRGRHFWLCRCDCGNEKVIGGHFLYGNKSRSCGCLSDEVKLRGLLPGETGFKRLFYAYKKSAKQRKLEFNLSEEDFKLIVTGNCHYCGDPPSNKIGHYSKHSFFTYNGIDRINNLKGYEKRNVLTSCWKCNRMKNILGKDDFLEQCRKICKYHPQ